MPASMFGGFGQNGHGKHDSMKTGFISDQQFWKDEHDSPLLSRNGNFVNYEKHEELCDRARGWLDKLNATDIEVDFSRLQKQPVREALVRIFQRDADRTWVPKDEPELQKRTAVRQQIHVDNLKMTSYVIDDYHQGLGYIAAFSSMFLSQPDTVRLCIALHKSPEHSKGYFQSEAEKFLSDSRVFMELVEKMDKPLHDHLVSKGVVPQMWAVKYFVGLCVHLLPFEAVFDYWELVFEHGHVFVFKFLYAFLQYFRDQIMAATSTSGLMTIMRVEDPHADWKFPQEIIKEGPDVWENIMDDAQDLVQFFV